MSEDAEARGAGELALTKIEGEEGGCFEGEGRRDVEDVEAGVAKGVFDDGEPVAEVANGSFAQVIRFSITTQGPPEKALHRGRGVHRGHGEGKDSAQGAEEHDGCEEQHPIRIVRFPG